jgi:hypothetical protein
VTKLLCPSHKGTCSPHPIRVRGPDLWYQIALVDTTVEQSLIISAGDMSVCCVRMGPREGVDEGMGKYGEIGDGDGVGIVGV